MNKRFIAVTLFSVIALNVCMADVVRKSDTIVNQPESLGMSGEQLVNSFCIRCHLAPNPTDLPRETWPVVLGWMGNFLGFPDFSINDRLRRDYINHYKVIPGMVPETAMMSDHDFSLLKEYLIFNALPSSEMVVRREPLPQLSGFEVVIPKLDLLPNNMLLGLYVDDEAQRLYVGSALENKTYLSAFDLPDGKRVGYMDLQGSVRDIAKTAKGIRVGTMGMYETTSAKTLDLENFDTEQPRVQMVIDDGCKVQTVNLTADLNGDKRDDILSTCFGWGEAPGSMSIYWQTLENEQVSPPTAASGQAPDMPGFRGYRRTRLIPFLSGEKGWSTVVDAIIADFNKDGRPDILAFIVNGYQQLVLLTNKGNEQFEQKAIAQFSPSAGGVSVTAEDFDKDGYPEIVVNLGNNEELSELKPVRPHHGIYIYQNNRDLSFTPVFFHHMQGAVKSVTGDFDGDGDIDIASVALEVYTEFEHSESFAYLENKGNWQFSATTLPEKYRGRWINIATGDVNQDGRIDIVLGDGSGYPWNAPGEDEYYQRRLGDRETYPPLLYLINKM